MSMKVKEYITPLLAGTAANNGVMYCSLIPMVVLLEVLDYV